MLSNSSREHAGGLAGSHRPLIQGVLRLGDVLALSNRAKASPKSLKVKHKPTQMPVGWRAAIKIRTEMVGVVTKITAGIVMPL